MTPEHLLLDCQEPHRRHSGPDRHGREPEIARAGYAACPRNPISELVDSDRTEEFDRSMRTATCDTNFTSLQLPRPAGYRSAIVSAYRAALFPSRGSKLMSKRDPVASARRSSVRIEGRVRPLSRRATAG